VGVTWITETVSMMGSAKVAEPVLVAVKAVEPGVYPFNGEVKLRPASPLATTLDDRSIGVSDDLLLRLEVAAGDTVRLGGAEFRIAAVVSDEPDKMAGSLNVGPRVLLSRAGLDRTGLLQAGSRASQRHLFRLPPTGTDVAEVRNELRRIFPRALVTDFRETHPLITRGLDRATRFLSLVSLIALIVGALGVATAMHSHLQQKMDSIAVMKSLGARSSQVMKIYLLQALALALVGGIAGTLVGALVQWSFPLLIARYFPVKAELRVDALASWEGIAVAILTTLLFTLPPLLGVRRIKPSVILRREMAETGTRGRWREMGGPAAAGALILVGIGLIAAWLAGGSREDAVRLAGWFTGGLAVS
ncbi:MAG: ABC transporter permease, partial [Bryobacteraceae bacterium]